MPATSDSNALTTDDLRIDAANWLRLQELYHLLETTPAEQQEAALDAATSDPILRARVLSLLATSSAPDAAPPPANLTIVAGARVGPYAIVRHLGSGGLGSVYLVERMIGGAVQQCALKLLAMRADEASFRAHFAREQQILATLQHPNITHLLDAGISDMGQPYLVMEFVDGLDLTRYCDDRALPLRSRLEIFLAICDAVIYAHSKLVVHLDLKPSNVLVTAAGRGQAAGFRHLQADRVGRRDDHNGSGHARVCKSGAAAWRPGHDQLRSVLAGYDLVRVAQWAPALRQHVACHGPASCGHRAGAGPPDGRDQPRSRVPAQRAA